MGASPEQVLLRDPHRYIAHPHMAELADGTWLLVATCGPRRSATLHPPLDPEFITLAIRSRDQGRTWSPPSPAPGFGHTGAECAGLTALPGGEVLLNQFRFRWYGDGDTPDEPVTAAAQLRDALRRSTELDGVPETDPIAWSRGGGTMTIWRSADGGRRWRDPVVPPLAPFSGGYGLRGGVVLADGEILLPLTDPPHYARVFLIRSHDGGRTWSAPFLLAAADGAAFEEPSLLALDDHRLLMLLRENTQRRLMATWSLDRGTTWSPPVPAGLAGYPAHLLRVPKGAALTGRIAAVTGIRTAPGAIRLTFSDDEGRSWHDATDVAGDLGTHDLGYPTAVVTGDGGLFVAYYRRDAHGVTGVYGRKMAYPGSRRKI